MFDQSQALPEPLAFLGKAGADAHRYAMATLNNESLEINDYRIHKFNLRDYFEVFFVARVIWACEKTGSWNL